MTAKNSIIAHIRRFRAMTVSELVPVYQDLHGKPPRSRHRDWLWRRCAWKLQERRFGGLSETAKRKLDELSDSIELPAQRASRTVSAHLRRSGTRSRGAHPSGGQATSRTEDGSPRRLRDSNLPPPGTTIVREWRGRELRLTFLEEGVEVDGRPYNSLTAAARAITGSKWNGRLFWLGRSGGR